MILQLRLQRDCDDRAVAQQQLKSGGDDWDQARQQLERGGDYWADPVHQDGRRQAPKEKLDC